MSRAPAPGATLLHSLSSLGAFLVPALALWLPSGYSYGAALLLVVALLASPLWLRQVRLGPHLTWLLLAIVLMAAVWLWGSAPTLGWSRFDRPAKYLMVVPCLLFLLAFPPRRSALFAGLAVGAAGAGLKALYDVQVVGLGRAWGYEHTAHNAIQYGNLSGLLGLMCAVLLLLFWQHWRPRTLLALGLCAGLGLLGSLLSGSRGGWLALLLCAAPMAWLLARWLPLRRVLGGGLLLLFALALLAAFKGPELQRRLALVQDEVSVYQSRGDAHSSVGQRLDHGQLAWRIGLDKPLLGWGEAAYQEEKKRRVTAGLAHPFVLEFGHAHNEMLDLFAKRGLVGVAGLLLFYAVPLVLFWPRRSHAVGTVAQGLEDLAVRLLGLLLAGAYIGFGLSQAFLAHNSGNLFYLFMVIVLFSLLPSRQFKGLA